MNALKERRTELGLTQPEVSARLAEVEPRIDVAMVSRYENGVALPTKEQIAALEELLNAGRTELWDVEDLDLLTGGRAETGEKRPDMRPSHQDRIRKCFRVSRTFADALPADLLEVCNFSSWQSWFDSAMRRLLAEYAARKKAIKQKQASARADDLASRGERI